MFPGFSGGPLVNALPGARLNTSALLRGLSLTVAILDPPPCRRPVTRHARIRRSYLGVSTQPVRLPAMLQERVGQETGLLLSTVEPQSPAEQGALLLGDTLIALDERPMRDPDDLLTFLSTDRIGATVRVRLCVAPGAGTSLWWWVSDRSGGHDVPYITTDERCYGSHRRARALEPGTTAQRQARYGCGTVWQATG